MRAIYISEVRCAWSAVVYEGDVLQGQKYLTRLDVHHFTIQMALFAHILDQDEDRARLLLHDVRSIGDEQAEAIQKLCNEVYRRLCDEFLTVLEGDDDSPELASRILESRDMKFFPDELLKSSILVPQSSPPRDQVIADTVVVSSHPTPIDSILEAIDSEREGVLAKPPLPKNKQGRTT